jgi:hypothetical protein
MVNKGESNNIQQQILASDISGRRQSNEEGRNDGYTAYGTILAKDVLQTALGQVSESHSMTQHIQQDSSGRVIGPSQTLLN